MCGRFNLTANPREVADLFGLADLPELPPRYNIAPSQLGATVGLKPDGRQLGLTFMRWGLLPTWAKGTRPAAFINAKSETAATKLLVADGRQGQGDLLRLVASHRPITIPLPSKCTTIGWPVKTGGLGKPIR